MFFLTFPAQFYLISVDMKMKKQQVNPLYASPWGMDLMMSESPGSVMERLQTRKHLPQAVPNSMLLPVQWWTPVLANMA